MATSPHSHWTPAGRESRRAALQLELAEHAGNLGLWHWDLDGNLLVGSGNFSRILGLPPDESTTSPEDLLEHLHSEDRSRVGTALDECRRTAKPVRLVTRARVDAGERVLELAAEVVDGGRGQPEEIAGYLRDVTDERQAREEVETLRHDLGERVKELALIHETARILQDNSQSVPEVFDKVLDRIPPAMQFPEVTMARLTFGKHQRQTSGYVETPWTLSADFVAGDGVSGRVEIAYREAIPGATDDPFLPEERRLIDSLTEMLKTFFSVRRVSGALDRSEQLLALALRGADMGLWDWSVASGSVNLDRRGAEMLGFPDERSSCDIDELIDRFHAEDREGVRVRIRNYLAGEDPFFEAEGRIAAGDDGEATWVLSRGQNVAKTGERDAARIVGTLLDITERKKTEELGQQLLRIQKMEAVGRLAGGVAHDFNNVLTVISGYSELLLAQFVGEDDLQHDLQEIHQASTRGANLTRQLLAFSRMQVLQPEILDLGEVILSLEKMIRRLIGEDVETIVTGTEDLWPLEADRGQLDQILMNLVVNARDAMPDGGRLTIAASNVVLDDDFVRAHPGSSPGPHVHLRVSDTGTGMDEETQARLFEPFFTTKERDKGTGLGLSTVYGIVKQSGGSIYVDSELGKGTHFDIYLPRCEGEPSRSHEAATPTRTSGPPNELTILLVEDDQLLRPLLKRVLQAQEWEVLDARNAAEALLLLEQRGGDVEVLLTDVIMPYMSGVELARRAREHWPKLNIIYMTGYLDRFASEFEITDGMILSKPFTPAVLVETIRERYPDEHGTD